MASQYLKNGVLEDLDLYGQTSFFFFFFKFEKYTSSLGHLPCLKKKKQKKTRPAPSSIVDYISWNYSILSHPHPLSKSGVGKLLCLFLYYWNTAISIGLHLAWGHFWTTRREQMALKTLKDVPSPFNKKVCWPLASSTHYVMYFNIF